MKHRSGIDIRILKDEFFTALFKGLVLNPTPNFLIQDTEVFRLKETYFTIQGTEDGELLLMAAAKGNFIKGNITPLIATILLANSSATLVNEALLLSLGVTRSEWDAIENKLSELGIG